MGLDCRLLISTGLGIPMAIIIIGYIDRIQSSEESFLKSGQAENRGIEEKLFEVIRSAWDGRFCHQTMGFRTACHGKRCAGMK